MSQCQCIKKSGQQCKLKVSKKESDNQNFCHVHQSSVLTAKVGPNVRTPKEKKILDWLAQTILEVVMTPGGGLWTVHGKNPQPTHNFATFIEYENWALEEIAKVENSGLDPDHEDYNWQYYDLFSDLCPMFSSNKDDGGRAYEKAMELQGIIASS
jgi:hypothetical protein